jgi:hypothetical protein
MLAQALMREAVAKERQLGNYADASEQQFHSNKILLQDLSEQVS